MRLKWELEKNDEEKTNMINKTIMEKFEEIRKATEKLQFLVSSNPMAMLSPEAPTDEDDPVYPEDIEQDEMMDDPKELTPEEMLSLEAQEEEPKEFEK
jgi:hypothetical protein